MNTGTATTSLRTAAAFTLVAASLLATPGHAQTQAQAQAQARPPAQACPALDIYYPQDDSQWPLVLQGLRPLESECLQSSEYYALLGAAQLNTGQLQPALEALERALLLDPANGGAGVDYAQALFLGGQLYPALELGASLLAREDMPAHLRALLEERQRSWQAQTVRKGLVAELGMGFDDNLNGAPSRSDITLTLSGEQIQVSLDEDFRPVEGGFLNARLAGVYQKRGPEYSHDFLAAVRNRASEHSQSDLLQLDWRYALGSRWQDWAWTATAGTSHLAYGGSPLYSVTETRFHFTPAAQGCQPQFEAAAQYQLYHGQSLFTGVETGLLAGIECRPLAGASLYGFEAGHVSNLAVDDARPGADRQGWKLRLYWQGALGPGQLNAQVNFASINDDDGYSPLIASGARRGINSRLIRLQYRLPLQPKLDLLLNLSHQGQSSNLGPFRNSGTALEVAVSYAL